jgi:hypothetical protein
VRNRSLLAFSLPLAAAGTLAGHAVGYAVVGSSRQDAMIHGYLGYAPQFLAICVALVAFSLALRITGRLHGRPAAWPFALVPPLAFGAQELIERLVAGLPAHAVFEPAVYVGLAAQAPVALLAYLAARALLRVADEATEALAAPRISLAVPQVAVPFPAPLGALRVAELAYGRLGRAPPR